MAMQGLATITFGEDSGAADLYPRLLAQRPGDLTLTNKLANIFLALRQIDQAEKLFQEVLPQSQRTPKPMWVWAASICGAPFTPWPNSILTRHWPGCLIIRKPRKA